MLKLNKTILAMAFGIAVSSMVGCGRIETGHVGVRTDFNKTIEDTELSPGWYGSLFTDVDEYSTKEIEVAQNDMRPKAKDNLSLQDLDISVFYKVNPSKVSDMLVKYTGMTYENNDGLGLPAYGLVDRQSRSVIFQLIGTKYDSLSIHQKRIELETDILAALQSDLDKADPKVFEITKVIVRQVTTDVALEESIRASVRVQKEIEAKRQQIELAKAEAERKIVEARGEAQANEIIASSITGNLIKLREIEMTGKFAQAGTHTVLMGGQATPLISTGGK
jgi:regulator of protease activity HflC (stomatin/prohibitin superfamily)